MASLCAGNRVDDAVNNNAAFATGSRVSASLNARPHFRQLSNISRDPASSPAFSLALSAAAELPRAPTFRGIGRVKYHQVSARGTRAAHLHIARVRQCVTRPSASFHRAGTDKFRFNGHGSILGAKCTLRAPVLHRRVFICLPRSRIESVPHVRLDTFTRLY